MKVNEIFRGKTYIKILEVLAEEDICSITQIVNATKSNHGQIKNALEHLTKMGIVNKNQLGKIKIYRLSDCDHAQLIRNFIRTFNELQKPIQERSW